MIQGIASRLSVYRHQPSVGRVNMGRAGEVIARCVRAEESLLATHQNGQQSRTRPETGLSPDANRYVDRQSV